MAREYPYGFKVEGAGIPIGRASYTIRSTKSGTKTTGSVSKKKKSETESTSYKGKELTKAEKKKIKEQNKAAESMKSKDLDKVDSGKKAAATRKLRQEEREDFAYGKGKKVGDTLGKIKGSVATATVVATGKVILDKNKKDKKDKKKSSKKTNKKK
jgi:hypothetical protein